MNDFKRATDDSPRSLYECPDCGVVISAQWDKDKVLCGCPACRTNQTFTKLKIVADRVDVA